MPRKRLEDVQPGFGSGLVLSGATTLEQNLLALPPDSLTVAQQCRITREGGLQKLRGSRRLHALPIDGANAIAGGFSWRKGDGTVQQLVTTDNLFTATYALPITWTSQTGALDGATKHSFAPFRDGSAEVVYIADGGLLNKWDGTTVTINIASTPSVSRIATYNQRLFGISGTDQNLYWSALNNGDSLGNAGASGGVAVIRTFGGQHLTALAAVGGSLLLFHANAISRFSGYSQTDIDIDAGAIGHSAELGTLAPRSVVVVNIDGSDVALFMTKRGLAMASESEVVTVFTPFLNGLGTLGNAATWANVYAVHNPIEQEVWFSLPSLGFYIYNYARKAWTGEHANGGNQTVWWLGETDEGRPTILSGALDGYVRYEDYPDTALFDIHSDNTSGTAVQMTARLRPWFFGDEALEKAFRHLYVTAEGVGGASTVQIQFGGTVSFTTELNTLKTFALPVWGVDKSLEININDQGDYPTLYAGMRGEAFALSRRR